MKNILVIAVLGIAIAALVWIYAVPQILCMSADGAWSFKTRVCDLGVVDVGSFDEENEEVESTENPNTYKDLITVTSPLPGSTVSSPITITGEARGMWFFEASFPVTVVNWDGLIIGQGIAQAEGEWMTENYVPFRATITYDLATGTPYKRGAIILQKDNPSGLLEHDDAFEFPINFE